MADAVVNLMVTAVLLPIAQSVPFPAAYGGLEHGAFSTGERNEPRRKQQHAIWRVCSLLSGRPEIRAINRKKNRASSSTKIGG